MINWKGKEKGEDAQEDNTPATVENIEIDNKGEVTVPESGNTPKTQATQNISAQDRTAIDKTKAAIQEAKEQQKIFGKFFQLDIGEETVVTIIPSKTQLFKVKGKTGDLLDQFRYYLIDVRAPDREKTFDTFASVAAAITERLDAGVYTMKLKATKNNTGGRKYIVEDVTN